MIEAYEQSTLDSFRQEFSWDDAEIDRAKRWGAFASELTTEIHEVLGHGSGRMADGVDAQPQELLKEQYSALEESRADLVALYFVADPYLVDARPGAGGASGRDRPRRIRSLCAQRAGAAAARARRHAARRRPHAQPPGDRALADGAHVEPSRSAAARARPTTSGRRAGLSRGVAELLAEVQRIKSEGDYAAARQLFETYGVHFDAALRDEIVARVDRLKLPSYTGFVMPRLDAVYDGIGRHH